MNQKVAIIQRRLTHYRVPLFEQMRASLAQDGVDLRLLYGTATAAELTKQDEGQVAWGEHLPTRYAAGGKFMWQPFMHRVSDCDLVIVPQENKHLHNLPPLLNPWRKQKFAYWGHGRNMQVPEMGGYGERIKRWLCKRVDWWFSYTEMSADYVAGTGFAREKITVLNNSIDTKELQSELQRVRSDSIGSIRRTLGLETDGPIGVYIGSLYAEKRIEFLLEASIRIKAAIPQFQLIVAGDGPERYILEKAVANHSFIHWLGPVHDQRKACVLAVGDVILNPGLVGLGILDGFVGGLPLLTTDCRLHSPEISYLNDGINGLMMPDDLDVYTATVIELLSDPFRLAELKAGAATAANSFSIEQMGARFCEGIQRALES